MTQDTSKQQVARYNIKKNTWAIIALSLFVLDCLCVLLFNSMDAVFVLVVMAILSVAAFLSALKIKDTSKTEQLIIVENPLPPNFQGIVQGLREEEDLFDSSGKKATCDSDTTKCFVMSFATNHNFVRFPLKANSIKEPYILPDSVLPYAGILKEDRNKALSKHEALRPNKEVVGLRSDIDPNVFTQDVPSVDVIALNRYSVQVTDDAFNKFIVNKKKVSDKIVFDGRKLALDESGHLRSFTASKMANQIDIHTLIISSDGYIMIARGTDEHPLRAGKTISSVACSLLPSELDERPIQESMIDSIHAKIKVSFALPEQTVMASSFCGMARIINRGGAPEFYCITRIGMTKEQLIKAHRDATSTFIFGGQDIPSINWEFDDIRGYIANTMDSTLSQNATDLSVSAAAMFCAVGDSMRDKATAGKILRRIGIIDDENDIN